MKKFTQRNLSDLTGINRTMISRIESCDYVPSIDQLQA
ncbi:MAG: helix-turn-helix transcriptional regulator, partial [Anaerococcus hydrogenalis]